MAANLGGCGDVVGVVEVRNVPSIGKHRVPVRKNFNLHLRRSWKLLKEQR
jgi:hypothetical protein